MNPLRLVALLILVLLLPMAGFAQAPATSYSEWKKNDTQKRWECEYTYPNVKGGKGKQVVAVYPKGNPRAGWAYYYNEQGKPWARCAVKGNPKYNADKMYWQQLNKDGTGYENYKDKPEGFCPTPKDGKEAIPVFPDPPI